ncbi:MAG TPA: iron-containing alcohol dehydrogenase [Rhizomicrobium sp.]|jgi:3-dehydroquinate synthase
MMTDDYHSVGGYTVHVVGDVLGSPPQTLRQFVCGRRLMIVTTPTVASLYNGLSNFLADSAASVHFEILAISERDKSMDAVLHLCRAAQGAGMGRHDAIIAVGGGVCSDVVRMAAALLHRGVAHALLPTTLIGQMDAGIGVKAGLNFGDSKSFLGVFRPPDAVFVEPRFLATLAPVHLRDGLAEVLKLAIVLERSLFELVEKHAAELVASGFQRPRDVGLHVLHRAIALTQAELDLDLYEKGSLRRLLDFGHTFSPLIEQLSGFSVSHGKAVMIDICLSAALAVELELLNEADFARIVILAQRLQLPTSHSCLDICAMEEAITVAIRRRAGALNLVLPRGLGDGCFVERDRLEPPVMARALARLARADRQSQELQIVAA